MIEFGLIPFRSPLLRESQLFSFPLGTEMFYFPRCASAKRQIIEVHSIGFSHSDIAGSKLVWQLPDAYRSQTTSFIAIESLGILRTPLSKFLVRNFENRESHAPSDSIASCGNSFLFVIVAFRCYSEGLCAPCALDTRVGR